MKRASVLTRRDFLVTAVCVFVVVTNLAGIGNGGRRRAKEMVCASNLRRWGAVLFACAEDHQGYFTDRDDGVYWLEALEPYYGNRKLLLCPEARRTASEGGRNPHMAWKVEYYEGDYIRGSYVINLWVAYSEGDRYWRTPYVSCASSVPMMLDGQWKGMQPYPFDEPPMYEGDVWTPGPYDEMRRACVNRHNGVNAVFMDGSVRKVGLKHLWVLWWYRGWEDDLAQVGFPAWPEWMSNFKEP